MVIEDTPLVVAQPGDTIGDIVGRIQETGAERVQLFVPQGVPALQGVLGFAELLLAVGAGRLLVISPDDQTLRAAQRASFETLPVGADAAPPRQRRAAPTMAPAPIPPLVPPSPRSADASVLDELDRMPVARDPELVDGEAGGYAWIDDEATKAPAWGTSAAPPDLQDMAADEDWNAPLTEPVPPRRRNRFETVPLPREEEASRDLPPPLPARGRGAVQRAAADDRRPPRQPDEETEVPWTRRLIQPLPLLVLGLLVALGAVALWLLASRTTIQVWPPPSTASVRPFTGEVIPLSDGSTASAGSVVALPAEAVAEASAQGTASRQPTPVGKARGTVRITNRTSQAIELPAGTKFIARSADGREIPFLIDGPVTVPPSVQTPTANGYTVTFGEIDVQISASSPGSASNVGANTVTAIEPPGGGRIPNEGNVTFSNGELTGGAEEDRFVVSQADVDNVIGEALTQLYAAGEQKLREQVQDGALDLDTVRPSMEALRDPQSYEVGTVEPPVGQEVSAENPVFNVVVRARFTGLVTPSGQPVKEQLGQVTKDHFAPDGTSPCGAGESARFDVSSFSWDGTRLTIDGATTCTPIGGLPPETAARVRDAVRGQPRDAAETGLRRLQEQGVIGGYQLPDRASFPGLDLLLDVQEIPPPGPTPTTGATP